AIDCSLCGHSDNNAVSLSVHRDFFHNYPEATDMVANSVWRTAIIVALVSATCGTMAAASDNDVAKSDVAPLPKGTLSGTVVDPDGKPVSDARVWVNTWGD